jgi:hypothetical protein
MGKESHEIISGYNTWWDNINKRHGEKSSGIWFGMEKYAKERKQLGLPGLVVASVFESIYKH